MSLVTLIHLLGNFTNYCGESSHGSDVYDFATNCYFGSMLNEGETRHNLFDLESLSLSRFCNLGL